MTGSIPDPLLGPLLERAAIGIAVNDAEGRFLYVNKRLAEMNDVPAEDHIGRTLREVLPHLADTVERLHARVLATGEPLRDVQVRGSTRGEPERSWLVSYLPIEVDGRRAVGVVLVDTTERDRAVEDAQRRVHQHAAVADLGQRALAGLTVDELMDAATEVLAQELQADQAGVLEFVRGRTHLVLCSGFGWAERAVGSATVELGRKSQAGFTLLTGAPVLVHDLEREERFEVSAVVRAVGARSAISTAVPGADDPYGVLGVFSRDVGHFDEDDASFVRAVANVLGAAVVREEQAGRLAELGAQRGRLVAQALEAGERQQRQVADVLHDDVLQHLLFARQELADADGEEAARSRASVEEATSKLRRVVAGLHPVTLTHAGLAAGIENLAGELHGRTGLRIEVHVDPVGEGPHDRLVVSLVRELLTNVAKHAQASRAVVRVEAEAGDLLIVVADDGLGMPDDAFSAALARGNVGLATLRERVEAVGGVTQVGPGLDGGGTGFEIRIPLL